MEISQPDSNVFSVRIVSIDHYMAPPIPDLDICYSSFQGGKVNEVPVIRIYGSTPAGQKICLHIHRALPYLYIPCADLVQPDQDGAACSNLISLSLEKALKLKGKTGLKRQHVHGCSLVRARKFYGYHASEELFAKIQFYYPHDVSRAANLLLGGDVLERSLQPHESHIPFLLQFLVDYNLYGMGYLHVSKMKFRHPVPDAFSRRKDAYNANEAVSDKSTYVSSDSNSNSAFHSPIWISSTIPDGWMWEFPSHLGSSFQDVHLVKRQSTCELEGDTTVEDILNQQFKLYSSLSQTRSEVKMVQSLIPIWEEEYERTGMHDAVFLSDPVKPLPEDVLRTLSHGLEFENKLMELCNESKNDLSCTPFEKDGRDVELIRPSPNEENKVELGLCDMKNEGREALKRLIAGNETVMMLPQGLPCKDDNVNIPGNGKALCPKLLLADDIQTSRTIGSSDVKVMEKEALRLLRWLASSQAAEDINSDDELACETILTPLLPATAMDKVLEKANMDFESESQQECQDILDSVDHSNNFEDLKGGSSSADHNYYLRQPSRENTIPQVDGSADDQISIPTAGKSSKAEKSNEIERFPQDDEQEGIGSSFTHKSKKRKPLWGSLPFSLTQKVNDDLEPFSRCCTETMEGKFTGSGNQADRDVYDAQDESKLVGSSVRDLMRRKRRVRKASLEEEQHYPKPLEDHTIQNYGQDERPQEFANSELSPRREVTIAHDVRHSYHIDDVTTQACGGSTEITTSISSNPSEFFTSANQNLYISVACCENDGMGDSECVDFKERITSEACVGRPDLCVQMQIFDTGDKLCDNERLKLGDSAGKSSLSAASFQKEILGVDDCVSKNAQDGKTSIPKLSKTPSTNIGVMEPTSDSTILQFENCGGGQHGQAADLSVPISSISSTIDLGTNPMELIGMTFHRKPPMVDLNTIQRISLDAGGSYGGISVSIAVEAYTTENLEQFHLCNGLGFTHGAGISIFLTSYYKIKFSKFWSCSVERLHSDTELLTVYYDYRSHRTLTIQRKLVDEILPFFESNCLKDGEVQKKSSTINDLDPHKRVVGVPTHYQNDGSYLYMLTPVVSPPSVDSVSRWLLHVDSGSSGSQIGSQGSWVESCGKPVPEPGSVSVKSPILGKLKQQICGDLNAEMNPLVKEVTGKQAHGDLNGVYRSESHSTKGKECSDCLLDMSQISGPDGKSKPTPVSQIGFRDPASFGGGQQLTLLSVEVQAESRGELRPDPRFDAVNLIVLAFQEDNDSKLNVYVLLRSNTEQDQSNPDGILDCKVFACSEEKLFSHFMNIIRSIDPDILMGWDIQGSSLGYLAERAMHLGISLLSGISRTPTETKVAARESGVSDTGMLDNLLPEPLVSDSIQLGDLIIDDEWGRTHASGVHVGGRVVLNIWRLMRGEIKLNMYTVEAVAEAVLRRRVPYIQCKLLARWFSSGPGRARYRCIEYVVDRAKLNLEIMNQLDMINRTSELARVFGIDFFSVLSRGSQYRVESMLMRLARTQNYVAISPGSQQVIVVMKTLTLTNRTIRLGPYEVVVHSEVASQPAMECLPLVMEPESGFYADPVVVLDFQSLYPSMIIAYNLCFCTCLGNVVPSKANTLGVSSFSPDLHVLRDLKQEILLTPNGVMYVPSKVRKGVLPRLLEEILSTRIMVKQAMKKLAPSQQVLHRIFNARQLALKLIANVTYGYTAAGFSGRMPCAELADSIVQCGRRTLENAISFVNSHDRWNAKVIYGDTDSMFVLLRGRTMEESFEIGREIASAVTAANPNPVTLKMEKVYHSCFLLTKKRYVGYSFESPDQVKPVFDAKGIETVRRDTCGSVAKIMEQSLRIFFECKDINQVKAYLLRQWKRILSGRVSLQDFVFAKEVRLGTYNTRASSSLPPAAIVAAKAMRTDPRAEPRYGERISYVVVHGEPGSRLVDMVVDPLDLLAIHSPFRLNDIYYITKQLIPALQRVFGLVGVDLNQWFSEMPRLGREFIAKHQSYAPNAHRTRIDYYYLSKHCVLCGELVQGSAHLCGQCLKNEAAVAIAIIGRTSKLEREIQHLAAIVLMVKFSCRFVGIVVVETGPWKVVCSAHHSHAPSSMRGGKSRGNYRLFLPLQQRQVYIQDVWLSGSEFTMLSGYPLDVYRVVAPVSYGGFWYVIVVLAYSFCEYLLYIFLGDVRGVEGVLELMEHRGVSMNAVTHTLVIKGYSKVCKMEEAEKVLQDMKQVLLFTMDERAYGVLIDAYCRNVRMDEALRMKDEMLGLGLEMNLFICNSIINGYCKLGQVHEAEGLVISVSSWQLKPDSRTYNALLDGYCRKGHTTEAFSICDKMIERIEPSVVTYNTLLKGLCRRGAFADALQLWHLLLERGVALSENGKITVVEEILEKMKELDYSLHGISYRTLSDGSNLEKMKELDYSRDGISYGTLSDGYLEAITGRKSFNLPDCCEPPIAYGGKNCAYSAPSAPNRKEKNKIRKKGKGSIDLSKTVTYGYTAAGLEVTYLVKSVPHHGAREWPLEVRFCRDWQALFSLRCQKCRSKYRLFLLCIQVA
ncbi:hypothetical protein RHMOL_Rhmol12G0065400 [Rhododendron molle]|uniref:Uncharacterized protein n=1 Tax=Rhododendron molle TaxID=49168 RepID=A0ACC0LFF2_RHOML|nr:hypothetical protein RHMOL_Rhmol12G0065400 [Rhododendron molle]